MVADSPMIWFWLGFFGLVALLLFLDLGVLHRKNHGQSLRSAALMTLGWVSLGLAFSGVIYLMYENHWLGAHLKNHHKMGDGGDAVITYVSAYLLEYALSVDNLFVIAVTFATFKIAQEYQHRVLFWGIIGAVVFRVAMLGGGVWLATKFDWIFYVFGGYLAYKGLEIIKEFVEKMRGGDDEEDDDELPRLVRWLRKLIRIEGNHQGKFLVHINGRRVLTILALCLITVELQDVVFALDSIPAVLSVSNETFIIVSSNIFAILGLRTLYFVLASIMAKFDYLELAIGLLLIGIGIKMVLHNHVHITHVQSLIGIAVILAGGVIASMIKMRGNNGPSEPGPASPSP